MYSFRRKAIYAPREILTVVPALFFSAGDMIILSARPLTLHRVRTVVVGQEQSQILSIKVCVHTASTADRRVPLHHADLPGQICTPDLVNTQDLAVSHSGCRIGPD